MPRTYHEALITCPFYQSMALKSITCEGITDECVTKLLFVTAETRDAHRAIFCESNFKCCEVYRMLEDKYDEE